jgi:hypothetical protein
MVYIYIRMTEELDDELGDVYIYTYTYRYMFIYINIKYE